MNFLLHSLHHQLLTSQSVLPGLPAHSCSKLCPLETPCENITKEYIQIFCHVTSQTVSSLKKVILWLMFSGANSIQVTRKIIILFLRKRMASLSYYNVLFYC